MYIRAKHYGTRTYYSLVMTTREKGKVKQYVICYLGKHPTLERAIAAFEEELRSVREEIRCRLRCQLDDPANTYHPRRLAQLRELERDLMFKIEDRKRMAADL